jgi:hypothetical protein
MDKLTILQDIYDQINKLPAYVLKMDDGHHAVAVSLGAVIDILTDWAEACGGRIKYNREP